MILEVLDHAEALELLRSDDLEQLLVADGELLVLRVLQVVLLNVGPHLLDHFMPWGLLCADDGSKVVRQRQALAETAAAGFSLLLRLIRSRSCVGSCV